MFDQKSDLGACAVAAMTQSMAFSPHVQPFQDRLHKWETNLHLCEAVLDAWFSLQRGWMYLEPVFSFPDLLIHLPTESKRFATVDRIWRKVLDYLTHSSTVHC
jgi:dynein heavy chain, axonemal